MDTINNDLTNLLQQMGVHKESLGITQRIVIIAGILIIAFVADYFCRKIVVPTIKKLTARTPATSPIIVSLKTNIKIAAEARRYQHGGGSGQQERGRDDESP